MYRLISNGRQEEAIQVMAEYYGEGDRDSPLVKLSFKEMVEEIETEGSDKSWWDYRGLLNSRSSGWRMVCVAGMAFAGQVGYTAFPICTQTPCADTRPSGLVMVQSRTSCPSCSSKSKSMILAHS